MRERTRPGGVLIGGPLLLAVFVVLCLTTFAALSMTSARADVRMSRPAAQSVSGYYGADSAAEHTLAAVDGYLKRSWELCAALPAGDRAAAYFERVQGLPDTLPGVLASWEEGACRLRYSVPVDQNRTLEVTLRIPSPDEGRGRYVREGWQEVYTADWEGDDRLEVWDGAAPDPQEP